jgi:adenylate cyclase
VSTDGYERRHNAASDSLAMLSSLIQQLGRCTDLDDVVTLSLDALGGLCGFEHSLLMVLDEPSSSLYTIASRGYDQAGIGSEIRVGEGVIGKVAAARRPMRVNNLQRMLVYARTALQSGEPAGQAATEIPMPMLPTANSQLAAPAIVMGQLVGVLAVDSPHLGAFTKEDEDVLTVVAHLVASAINVDRVEPPVEMVEQTPVADPSAVRPSASTVDGPVIRFYPADGSTFIGDEYLVKGVPGRILCRLVSDHVRDGRIDFTNRELRLDPSLELPAFRDNLESRLVLLKRRLDERVAPMRIEQTGRGRFRLQVHTPLRLELAEP